MPKLLGKAPNQVPTNADLGTMAFQDREGINVNNAIVANLVVTGATSVNTNFAITNATSTVAFFAANGNVGIANSTPTEKLRVEGTASFLTSAAVGANVIANTTALFLGNSTVNTVITQTTASFSANSTYGTLVVAANGNVGVGISAPTSRLMVNGSFRSVVSSQGDYVISHSGLVSTAGAVAGVQLGLTGGGIEAIRIDTGANVGIGNTTPNAKLQVTGTANISGNVALGGALTVAGNLTVSGTTTYINTTNLDVGDNIITLNADLGAVAPTEDAGFVINRGTSANVSFTWDETNDRWTFGGDGANNAVRQSSNGLIRTSFINSAGIWDYFGNTSSINAFAEFSIFGGVNRLDNRTRDYLIANSTANNVMFAANGNVGIGNTTPTDTLVIENNAANNIVRIRSTNSAVLFIESDSDNVDENHHAQIILSQDGGVVRGRIGYSGGGNGLGIINEFGDVLALGSNNVATMYIVANGNIGIGNSTPAHALRIESGVLSLGNSSSNVQITIPTSVIASATNYWLNANGQWAIVSGVAAAAGGSNTHIQYNNSGTVDGSAALTFNNTTNNVTVANTLIVGNSTVNSSISTTGASIGANSTTTALFVAANGNVGIGNTAPVHKLSVNGNAFIGSSLNVATTFASGNATITGFANVVGNLQVTDTIAGNNLTLSGNLTVSGTTTYINTTTLNIGDNIITLNADVTGVTTPSENAGIEINRGAEANATFVWNETSDAWFTQVGAVTKLAVSNTTVSVAGNTSLFLGTTQGGTEGGELGFAGVAGDPNRIVDIDGSNNWRFNTYSSNGNIVFNNGASPVTRLQISANGNIGIGNTAPAQQLQVTGTAQISNSSASVFLAAANGNIGIGNTAPTDKLSIEGNIRANNLRRYTATRTLSTTVNDTVEIGTLFAQHGAHSLLITVQVTDSGISIAKQYEITSPFNATGSTAYRRVIPARDVGPFGGNDFDLEAYHSSETIGLRLRRTLGTTAGIAEIMIDDLLLQSEGSGQDTFTPSTTTATGVAVVTDIFPGNRLVHTGISSTNSFVIVANTSVNAMTSNNTVTAFNLPVTFGGTVTVGFGTQFGINLTTSATTANQVATSVAAASFRSAKFLVQVTSGSAYQLTEITLIHDGTNVYKTEYGQVFSGAVLATFDADINSGNMRLLTTPTNAVTVYKGVVNAILV